MKLRTTVGIGLVMSAVALTACKRNRFAREPVAYTTAAADSGPIVLRSALESFGTRVADEDVRKALHLHEMDVPASPEAMTSSVIVSRDGGLAHVRGAVVVTLRH